MFFSFSHLIKKSGVIPVTVMSWPVKCNSDGKGSLIHHCDHPTLKYSIHFHFFCAHAHITHKDLFLPSLMRPLPSRLWPNWSFVSHEASPVATHDTHARFLALVVFVFTMPVSFDLIITLNCISHVRPARIWIPATVWWCPIWTTALWPTAIWAAAIPRGSAVPRTASRRCCPAHSVRDSGPSG